MQPTKGDVLFKFKKVTVDDDEQASHVTPWTVLSVEDDAVYQQALKLEVERIEFLGRHIKLLMANSAEQAAKLLAKNTDVSVVLLDVVMENDDAGLRLISTIRNALNNLSVRIVLLTGQPSMAPRMDVMENYDVNEYWNKADLTYEKLRATLVGNIRSWQAHQASEMSREGLQLLLNAAKNISPIVSIENYSSLILTEISKLTSVNSHGIVCIGIEEKTSSEFYQVIAASGLFESDLGKKLIEFVNLNKTRNPSLGESIATSLANEAHVFQSDVSVLYFDTSSVNGSRFLMVVNNIEHMSRHQMDLLRVFCENIHDGFKKIGLLNRLNDLAYRDGTLHIPNRNWLLEKLGSLNEHDKKKTVLLFLQIKDLTEIELSTGHLNCVNLLSQYCRVLKLSLPGSTSLSRISYDTLVVEFFVDQLPEANVIGDAAKHNLLLGDTLWTLMAKIVVLPLAENLEESPDTLLSLGAAALNLKSDSGPQCILFDSMLKHEIMFHQELIFDLSAALNKNEFFIVLQPKIHLETKKVVGFEALIRWRKSDGTIVPPGQFIPVAEASGLISRIDSRTLDMTVEAVRKLSSAGYPLRVSFNATVYDLLNSTYVEKLLNIQERTNLPATLFDLEITESMAMESYDRINPLLTNLIQLGFNVSIDDFGTGYSSLSHIHNMAATHLKMDQSFVKTMFTSRDGADIADIILNLGRRFNFLVIAEGIETVEQYEGLIAKGCEYGQGYYFAKPMPIDEALVWLQTQRVDIDVDAIRKPKES